MVTNDSGPSLLEAFQLLGARPGIPARTRAQAQEGAQRELDREEGRPGCLERAEQGILDRIRRGSWACQTVAGLVRAGSLAGGRGTGRRALAGLLAGGWLVQWVPPSGSRLVTLSPWGAWSLDWALIQAADDGTPDPRWGRAGADWDGPYDHPDPATGRPAGLYLDEPDHFKALLEWPCLLKIGRRRSQTRLDRIARARAVKAQAGAQDPVLDDQGAPILVWGQAPVRDPRVRGKG